jgi:hypothetical protein
MAGNRGKHHQRTIDKMHILIRLELGNPLLSSTDIAKLAGIGIGRFAMMKRLPLYQQLHNQYMTGVITRLDTKVDKNLTLTQETLGFAVPMAMQALLKQAMQEKDLRVQNKACNDILDRDGHFAKVRRIGLATTEQGGAVATEDKDNVAAAELIKAMQGSKLPNISDPPLTETKQ